MSILKTLIRHALNKQKTAAASNPENLLDEIASRFLSTCISTTGRIAAGEKLSNDSKYSVAVELLWLSGFLLIREAHLQAEGGALTRNATERELLPHLIDEVLFRFFDGPSQPEEIRLEQTHRLNEWFNQAKIAYRSCKNVHPSERQLNAMLRKGGIPEDCVLGKFTKRLSVMSTRKSGIPFPAKLMLESMTFCNSLNIPELANALVSYKLRQPQQ